MAVSLPKVEVRPPPSAVPGPPPLKISSMSGTDLDTEHGVEMDFKGGKDTRHLPRHLKRVLSTSFPAKYAGKSFWIRIVSASSVSGLPVKEGCTFGSVIGESLSVMVVAGDGKKTDTFDCEIRLRKDIPLREFLRELGVTQKEDPPPPDPPKDSPPPTSGGSPIKGKVKTGWTGINKNRDAQIAALYALYMVSGLDMLLLADKNRAKLDEHLPEGMRGKNPKSYGKGYSSLSKPGRAFVKRLGSPGRLGFQLLPKGIKLLRSAGVEVNEGPSIEPITDPVPPPSASPVPATVPPGRVTGTIEEEIARLTALCAPRAESLRRLEEIEEKEKALLYELEMLKGPKQGCSTGVTLEMRAAYRRLHEIFSSLEPILGKKDGR